MRLLFIVPFAELAFARIQTRSYPVIKLASVMCLSVNGCYVLFQVILPLNHLWESHEGRRNITQKSLPTWLYRRETRKYAGANRFPFHVDFKVDWFLCCISARWFDKVTFGAFWQQKSRHFILTPRCPLKALHLLPSITFHISHNFCQHFYSLLLCSMSFQLTFSNTTADNSYPEC